MTGVLRKYPLSLSRLSKHLLCLQHLLIRSKITLVWFCPPRHGIGIRRIWGPHALYLHAKVIPRKETFVVLNVIRSQILFRFCSVFDCLIHSRTFERSRYLSIILLFSLRDHQVVEISGPRGRLKHILMWFGSRLMFRLALKSFTFKVLRASKGITSF
jgi:hypothetical protein